MALNFPPNPQLGDTYVAPNGYTYTWDGTKWYVSSSGTGAGTAPIVVLDESTVVNTVTTRLNFLGAGITAVLSNTTSSQVDITVANPGLSYFSESQTTQSLDRDLNTLMATSLSTDASIAIEPKGNGAIQGDSTGDQRGIYATDWQKQRGDNTQVASGDYAVIGGGSFNKASGLHSAIVAGNRHIADSSYSVVVGGGSGNTNGTIGAVVFPGYAHGGNFSTPGVMQSAIYNIGGITTNNIPRRLSTDGSATPSVANQIITKDRSVKHFKAVVVAKEQVANDAAIWTFSFEGVLRQDVGSTTTDFMPAGIAPVITTASNTTSVASLRLDLDNVTGCMIIEATGPVGKTVRWTGRVETVELTDDN